MSSITIYYQQISLIVLKKQQKKRYALTYL